MRRAGRPFLRHLAAAAVAFLLSPALCLGADPPAEKVPDWLSAVPGWIVFDSKREGQFDIYKMRPDGSQVTRLTDTPDWETCPDWSPDAKSIVFARKPPGEDDISSDLYLMDADGGHERQLVKNGIAPQFTPDGKGIIFERDRVDVFRYDLKSGRQQRLLPPERKDYRHHIIKPRMAPDGRTIAFISDKNGKWHNWTMDPEGNERLIGSGCEPFWTPDGRKIFYIADTSYQENTVMAYDWPDGPARQFLTLTGTWRHAYFPSVSDDGRYLLLAACPFTEHDHSSANYQIFILPLAGGDPVRLSRNHFTERWPRLSTRAR